jgi:subtilisin family serine protease
MSGRSHPYFYIFIPALLVAGLLIGWSAAAAQAAPDAGSAAPLAKPGRSWDCKLDPFLRRMALGVERRQGVFDDRLPARSRAALEALPPFVRAERDGDDPILYVKARLRDDVVEGAGRATDRGSVHGAPTSRLDAGLRRLPSQLAGRLDALGVTVRGRAGSIVTLAVPASALESTARLDEILWLRAGRSYTLQNDVSTSDTFTAARTENSVFGQRGEGVIVATIDSGADWTSPDFRNPDGTTRFVAIWDQTIGSISYPPPAGFTFGSYYSRADIDAALAAGTDLPTHDGFGHGTHVLGSAAGNGLATGNGVPQGTFAGMAPGADLIAVRAFTSTGEFCPQCDLVAAVEFIDGVARARREPWVGNMSLGGDIGPHDGTDPDELAIDAVVRPGRAGSQMAIAAGNEGASTRHFHWQGNLPAVAGTATTTFTLNSLAPNAGSDTDFIFLDLWYEGIDDATVAIQTPGAQVVSASRGADSGIVCTTSGAVQVDATNAGDPENGDNEVFVTISDSAACAPVVEPATGLWTVRVTTNALGGPTGGPFDLWNYSTTPRSQAGSGSGWVQLSTFNLAKSVSIPGTARNALTAGAFVSKTSWINGAGTTTTPGSSNSVGGLCSFSGIGPTRDGRNKPDFTAPGEWLGSTKSKDVPAADTSMERDKTHVGFYRGTSMATPHVAGAAALLLGLHPDFDSAQVRAALQHAAREDLQTGPVPNTRYGWGKLRVLEGAYDAAAMSVEAVAGSDGITFSWGADPALLSWNVYRGPLPRVSAVDFGACFASGLSGPTFTDTDVPAVGAGFFYLVTGVYLSPTTGLPVEGILGTDSSGNLRPNSAPCP